MSKENNTLVIYPADIYDGLAVIAHARENIAPNLVDANLSPCVPTETQRHLLVAISMLASFSPRYDQETNRIDLMFDELHCIATAVGTYEATKDVAVLGGIVRAIKDDVVGEIIKATKNK